MRTSQINTKIRTKCC